MPALSVQQGLGLSDSGGGNDGTLQTPAAAASDNHGWESVNLQQLRFYPRLGGSGPMTNQGFRLSTGSLVQGPLLQPERAPASMPLADSWGPLRQPAASGSRALQLVHGSVGAGHFRVTKTFHRLRSHFYWPCSHEDVELHVHRFDSCTGQKWPTQHSHALQQYQVGAPMEYVGVDILGPFPTTNQGIATSSWPWTTYLSGPYDGCMRSPPGQLNLLPFRCT